MVEYFHARSAETLCPRSSRWFLTFLQALASMTLAFSPLLEPLLFFDSLLWSVLILVMELSRCLGFSNVRPSLRVASFTTPRSTPMGSPHRDSMGLDSISAEMQAYHWSMSLTMVQVFVKPSTGRCNMILTEPIFESLSAFPMTLNPPSCGYLKELYLPFRLNLGRFARPTKYA